MFGRIKPRRAGQNKKGSSYAEGDWIRQNGREEKSQAEEKEKAKKIKKEGAEIVRPPLL